MGQCFTSAGAFLLLKKPCRSMRCLLLAEGCHFLLAKKCVDMGLCCRLAALPKTEKPTFSKVGAKWR